MMYDANIIEDKGNGDTNTLMSFGVVNRDNEKEFVCTVNEFGSHTVNVIKAVDITSVFNYLESNGIKILNDGTFRATKKYKKNKFAIDDYATKQKIYDIKDLDDLFLDPDEDRVSASNSLFKQFVTYRILGYRYYNEGMDAYTCNRCTVRDILNNYDRVKCSKRYDIILIISILIVLRVAIWLLGMHA